MRARFARDGACFPSWEASASTSPSRPSADAKASGAFKVVLEAQKNQQLVPVEAMHGAA